MKSTSSLEDQEIIRLLKNLGLKQARYPAKLLSKRRSNFIKLIEQRKEMSTSQPQTVQHQDIVGLLERLQPVKVEYPSDLLAERRSAFIELIAHHEKASVVQPHALQTPDVVQLLEKLRTEQVAYPGELLSVRRAAFVRQTARYNRVYHWKTLWAGIQSGLGAITQNQMLPMVQAMRTSLVLAVILAVVLWSKSITGNQNEVRTTINVSPASDELPGTVAITETAINDLGKTICKPGYVPPMCLVREFNKQDLTFQGNGFAHPAVAKDTMPGFDGIFQPAYVNDGLYGTGASWVSYSANSWIKIDLGRTTTFNTVEFGKDRLGNFSGHDPGQFTIDVALSDNIYANGDSSNDNREYKQVYDSKGTGFNGVVSGQQTVQAVFAPVLARYVKITVTNPGAAIDEVEVFMMSHTGASYASASATSAISAGSHSSKPTSTHIPTNTPLPTKTFTPIPTNTPLPTFTYTPLPTNTPVPTFTYTPLPTNTPVPTFTYTPLPTNTPVPTNTTVPAPTNTPLPTNTPVPAPTNTSLPTNTPLPAPTNTSLPTSTPLPAPINTSLPTSTPLPAPTNTP